MKRMIMECARCMRLHAGFPCSFLFYKNYSFLRNFGCEAFVNIYKETRTKFEATSKKLTFIGYMVDYFGYCLWDYENQKRIRSTDVVFNENVMYKDKLQGKKEENKNTEYTMLNEIKCEDHAVNK